MKILLKTVFLICTSWLLSYNIDWRFSYLLPFLLILLVPHRSIMIDFLVGFISIAMVWLTASLIIDGGNNSVLSSRLAQLFGLSNGPTLVMISGLLGGILGGMGAITGQFLYKSFHGSNDNL